MDTLLKYSSYEKGIISHAYPEQSFWDNYTRLWSNSQNKSVFQSPHYLQFLANKFKEHIAIYQFKIDEKLKGAAFFRKEGKVFHFLSDVKSDHNFFIIDRECNQEQVQAFFDRFYEELKKNNWTLTLKNLALWAPYHDVFEEAGKRSNLFWMCMEYSMCPVLEEESPEQLSALVDKSREHRIKTKKLIDEQDGVFEIFRAEEDLDVWVRQFCKFHIERWEGTPSPSKYKGEQAQIFLKECLSSWARDGVLVRFSIRKGEERIAFVIGLLEEGTLIHHATSYDAGYYKLSPGKVLTYLIIQWMKQMGLNKLDFGEGAEDYKFAYANKTYPLGRAFISSRANYPYIVNTHFIKLKRTQLQNNPRLRKLYHEALWPVRRKVKSFFHSLFSLIFF